MTAREMDFCANSCVVFVYTRAYMWVCVCVTSKMIMIEEDSWFASRYEPVYKGK